MESTIEIELKWENDSHFEMTMKPSSGDAVTIVRVEENGCLTTVWNDISGICKSCLARQLDLIGEEMKL